MQPTSPTSYCLELNTHSERQKLQKLGLKTETQAERILLQSAIGLIEKRLKITGAVDLSVGGLDKNNRAHRRLAFEIEKNFALQKNPNLAEVYADREKKLSRSVL